MDAEIWTQRHVTGHAGIDAQHRVLFTLLERARHSLAGAQLGDQRQVVLDLMKYVIEHFNYELSLMRQNHYAELEQHHANHQRLISDVLRLKQVVFAGQSIGGELDSFLVGWIEHHIDDDDHRLAAFLSAAGIGL